MALKVFDLACNQGHVFEGWFRSSENYDEQMARGLLSCPVCQSKQITKKLAAPRLNLQHGRDSAAQKAPNDQVTSGAATASPAGASDLTVLQAQFFNQLKKMIKNTDNVGDDFAVEARKMHEGEAPERAIRGSATAEEYQELQQDGIAVMAIPEFLGEDKLN